MRWSGSSPGVASRSKSRQSLVIWSFGTRTPSTMLRIESEQIRSVLYVCVAPRALASPEDLALKRDIFEKYEANPPLASLQYLASGQGSERWKMGSTGAG